jgi:hypothetical protein
MSESNTARIWAYLDAQLSPADQVLFEDWLRESSDHRAEFARAAMLHDRLRGLLGGGELTGADGIERPSEANSPKLQNSRQYRWAALGRVVRWAVSIAVIFAAFVLGLALWQGIGSSELRASVVDLQRLNDWSRRLESRSFRIRVLDDRPEPEKGRRGRDKSESTAPPPPKRPLDGALLHARGDNQFVLEQRVPREGVFLTGFDGKVGWSISPQGAVRTSKDLNHFNRDIPGHEHELPLNSLFASLDRLEAAYRIQIFPADEAGESPASGAKSLLVATKKRGQRGSERIEVTYEASSGRILGMRLIDMPYGPRRLDLELILEAEGTLEQAFFGYEVHRDGNRPVVSED